MLECASQGIACLGSRGLYARKSSMLWVQHLCLLEEDWVPVKELNLSYLVW